MAGIYTPGQLGITAPPGGFQQGGWYSGRQYWGGTFSDAGVIHPNSNQQGAGSAVSSEVNRQSDAAQGLAPGTIDAYVQQQNDSWFNNPSQVQTYTNGVQNNTYRASGAGGGSPTISTLTDNINSMINQLPTAPTPPPSMADQFSQLSTERGVDSLEATVNDLTKQLRDLEAEKRLRVTTEEGKPVALNVMSGRVSEVERQMNERIDAINREKAYAVDQLNSAYKGIEMIMNFTNQDYQNARQAYNDQFNNMMSMITLARGLRQDEISAQEHAQDVARANAQLIMNQIQNGGMSYNSLSPDQKAYMNNLELQAGLPIGFFGAIQIDPKANIISTSSNNGQIQVLIRNADGSMSMKTYGTSGGGSGKISPQTAVADMEKTLAQLGGSDGIVSPEEWNSARQVWIGAGLNALDFDQAFATQHINWGYQTDRYNLEPVYKKTVNPNSY